MKDKLNKITNYQNIREIINEATEKFPNNNAFILKNKNKKEEKYINITFTKFQKDINSLGTALIKKLEGKRIAIIGPNRYEWAVSYLAVVNGVGIAVPLDKGLKIQEIESLLIRSKADAIIFDGKYIEVIQEIYNNQKTNVKEFICMDDLKEKSFTNYSELLTKGAQDLDNGDKEYINAEIDNEKMSIILFTSGTTDISKAVMLSHKNIASNVYGTLTSETIYDTDTNMAFLPFHHTFGSTGLLIFLASGATTVFCDGLRYISQNLREYKVTVFFCVPLILEAMHKKIMQEVEKQGKMKQLKFALAISKILLKFKIDIRRKLFKNVIDGLGGYLRFAISGAASLNAQVSTDLNNFGILTVQGYGLTETSPVLSAENKYTLKNGSSGLPLSNIELKIENPDEKGIGEIVAKGPNVMLGYYENEEATKEVLKDGWFHTGDLGCLDKDGRLFITGRKKSVIVQKNGKNIYPEELEMLVSTLPYVAENIVIGIPKGEDVILLAKIVYNEEYIKEKYPNINNDELKEKIWNDIKIINEGLPNYKHIKKIIITNEPMEKTTTNKIKRYAECEKIRF